MGYVFKQESHSTVSTTVSRGADGKVTGTRSIVKHETDEHGKWKDAERRNYVLNENGDWVEKKRVEGRETNVKAPTWNGGNLGTIPTDYNKGQECTEKARFHKGDIIKAEYEGRNYYAAYLDETHAYWILGTSPVPTENAFRGDEGLVEYDKIGLNINDFKKAPRDEVFAVEHFITANFGYRWDWRNFKLVKE